MTNPLSIRPGRGFTLAAAALAAVTAAVLLMATEQAEAIVNPMVVLMLVLHAVALFLGSTRLVGAASVPVLVCVVAESALSADPGWISAGATGLLWYLTLELSWEAVDRRSGATWSTAANLQRVQDVASVAGLSCGIGLVSVLVSSNPPTRSVTVQALTLLAVFGGSVVLLRRIASESSADAAE